MIATASGAAPASAVGAGGGAGAGFDDDDEPHAAAVNSLALTEALFKAGKPFDFVALAGTHMVADPASDAALMTRQIEFFRAHLGLPVAR